MPTRAALIQRVDAALVAVIEQARWTRELRELDDAWRALHNDLGDGVEEAA